MRMRVRVLLLLRLFVVVTITMTEYKYLVLPRQSHQPKCLVARPCVADAIPGIASGMYRFGEGISQPRPIHGRVALMTFGFQMFSDAIPGIASGKKGRATTFEC